MKKILLGLIGLLFAIPAVADLDPCRNLVNINASNIDIGHYISTSGAYSASSSNFLYIPYVPVNPDTTYTLTWGGDELYFITISEYSTNNDSGFIRRNHGTNAGNTSLTITTGENTHYIRFGSNPYGNNNQVTFEQVAALRWQLEQGNATEYVPYCANQIRIATTAYNSARFSPVVTELNDTIATIRSVVTNTINQTKAIADLQATKQTRPEDACPAGKKCLLVEDNDGIPHWYEIIESANHLPDGYIERQYIYMMDGSYIKVEDLPISAGYRVEFDFQTTTLSSALRNYLGGRASDVAAGGGFRLSKLASGGTTLNRVVLYGFESGTEYYDPTAQFQANTRYKYTYDNGVCTLESGGSVVSTQTFTVTDTTSTPWGINIYHGSGGWGTSGTSDGIYVYSLRVWNAQGELVMDLIPAENSSGVVGMYDTVSRTFKTATAGTFEAGPEI